MNIRQLICHWIQRAASVSPRFLTDTIWRRISSSSASKQRIKILLKAEDRRKQWCNLWKHGSGDGEVATLLDSLNMTLTQSDIGKTYSYTFAETKGNAAGYTYDENNYKLE